MAVAQQLADRAQALAKRQRTARPGVPQIVEAHVVQPGLGPYERPRIVDVLEAGARPPPGDRVRVVLNPGYGIQNVRRRGRQRHHARAGLAVAQPQFARRPVDIVPAQLQHLVASAPCEHQQPDRRRRVPRHRPPGLQPVERPAEPAVLGVRQEPLTRPRPVLAHRPARVRPGLAQAPLHSQGQHLADDLEHRVRRMRLAAHRMVQFRHLHAPDRADRHLPQRRQDVVVERPPVDPGGRCRAARRHPIAHVAFRQVGHGRLGRRRGRQRVLAPLDAVDGNYRAAARLLGGNLAMATQGRAPRPAGTPALDDILLQARRIDPDAEARQVPVPEDGVPVLDRQRVDGTLGDDPFLAFRHGRPRGCFQSARPVQSVSNKQATGFQTRCILVYR